MWARRIGSRGAALVATLSTLLLVLLAVLHLPRAQTRSTALTTVETVRGPPTPPPTPSPSTSSQPSSSPTPTVAAPSPKPSPPSSAPSERLQVVSTAYCETGLMASGERTYDGAVAMAEPMGSRWRILTGPLAGIVMTVADRYGGGTQFDIAMPGRCADARLYGRRQILVEHLIG